jgi:hypothetical protein
LEVGASGSALNHAANPTSLHELTFRTGGAFSGKNDISLKINSNDVIADQLWIWRADHGVGTGWTSNISKNGLVVNGNNVTIYVLFNEHHNEYQTLWNGNGGRVYFYQSEIPGDVPNQPSWRSKNGIRLAEAMATRWSTGTAMVPVQSFNVDMKAVKSINQIVMDSTGSDLDDARGYEVCVSNDGTNWGNAVASGNGNSSSCNSNLCSSEREVNQSGADGDSFKLVVCT